MEGPFNILAVDNEPSVTVSLKFVFTGPRYKMQTVDSGEAALALLEAGANLYDLIIVDQKMPNLTGVQLVAAMKELGVSAKIIVLSAHVSSDIREEYERLDVQAIFSKPFDLAELRGAVDRLTA